ncbi:MAG: CoA transferase subunit A [Burkholderiaceae bacterium]
MKLSTPAELAAIIPDGCKLAVAKDETGVAVAVTAALVARQARDLHLVCLPISGLQADLLIAAGCIATVETSAVTMGEYGAAPSFLQAVRTGAIKLLDGTCPAIHAGIQASQKGVPFAVLRGILDSELLEHRTDWRVIDNPFANDDPIVAIKAIDPDVALIHAQAADRFGNVFIGRERDCLTLAHAAKRCLVTVEEIVDGNLLDDPAKSAGVLPALYVDAISHVPAGAWPIGFGDHYGADDTAMRDYLGAARASEPADGLLRKLASKAPWGSLVKLPDTPVAASANADD